MDHNVLIIILIVAAVVMSEDRILTMLVASIALNLSLLVGSSTTSADDAPRVMSPAAAAVKETIEPLAPDAIDELYGMQYNAWSAHSRSYDMYPEVKPHVGSSCAENDYSVDTIGALITQKRGARDKRAMDGAITKGVDYYKYHYADELDEEEAKPWWGRHEW